MAPSVEYEFLSSNFGALEFLRLKWSLPGPSIQQVTSSVRPSDAVSSPEYEFSSSNLGALEFIRYQWSLPGPTIQHAYLSAWLSDAVPGPEYEILSNLGGWVS